MQRLKEVQMQCGVEIDKALREVILLGRRRLFEQRVKGIT